MGCNLLKRTESSGIVPTKSGVMKDSAEVKHESTVWLFRDALTFSDVLIGIDFSKSGVRCELHKQSRLTFFKIGNRGGSRKSMTESGGLPEVQTESGGLKAPCGFFEVHP